ncbi:MAG TPA: hypothetical protein VFS15_10530 [Kofleriaceae bacterium]|nr:hypothetical protein [Kofleriaceae bacterium]
MDVDVLRGAELDVYKVNEEVAAEATRRRAPELVFRIGYRDELS